MRIEGASGTPKKGFKIEKVKIHGVGPLRNGVGIASSEQEDDVICDMVLRSSSSSIAQNDTRLPLDLPMLLHMAPLTAFAFVTVLFIIPARMLTILLSKKDANSLHFALEAGSDCL